MAKVKDLSLMYESRWDDTLTGDVSITNILAKSEGLTSMSFTLSQQPLRKIVFQFPPLSDDEDYTAVITLPRKAVPVAEPVVIPIVDEETADSQMVDEALKALGEDPKEVKEALLNEITEIKRKRKVRR